MSGIIRFRFVFNSFTRSAIRSCASYSYRTITVPRLHCDDAPQIEARIRNGGRMLDDGAAFDPDRMPDDIGACRRGPLRGLLRKPDSVFATLDDAVALEGEGDVFDGSRIVMLEAGGEFVVEID